MRLDRSVVARSAAGNRVDCWDPRKASINETVTICGEIRPRSLVGFCVLVIPRFANVAVPMVFEASSLQSRIFGIGMLVLACRYLMVETSELVVNLGGPASTNGSLTTTRFALSVVKIKTLLKPPSFLS